MEGAKGVYFRVGRAANNNGEPRLAYRRLQRARETSALFVARAGNVFAARRNLLARYGARTGARLPRYWYRKPAGISVSE